MRASRIGPRRQDAKDAGDAKGAENAKDARVVQDAQDTQDAKNAKDAKAGSVRVRPPTPLDPSKRPGGSSSTENLKPTNAG